jgi:hypothetical protein
MMVGRIEMSNQGRLEIRKQDTLKDGVGMREETTDDLRSVPKSDEHGMATEDIREEERIFAVLRRA